MKNLSPNVYREEDWKILFFAAKKANPEMFAGFEVGGVEIPRRRHVGCVVYDSRGRYWLAEVEETARGCFDRRQLVPVYGPFDGFPTGNKDCPFEKAVTEALSKNRRKAA